MFKIQKEEALKRMRLLKLHGKAVKEFKEEGILNKSESGGFLFWLSDKEKEEIEKWEEETENLAYHVIFNQTEIGNMLSVLYVSKYEEEWEMDNQDIEDGYAYAYVINLNNPMFSEIGSIGFERNIGGLIRIA